MCHGTNGQKGLDVTAYASLMKGSEDGPVIVPGDPAGSALIQVQTEAQPHFAQLTSDELKLVTDWILAGAPEN